MPVPSRGSADRPLPSEVEGFREAAAAGLTPAVPRTPPALVPGTTAAGALRRLVLLSGLGIVLFVIVIRLAAATGAPTLARWALIALAGIAVLAALQGLAAVGRRNVAELGRGYTTLVLQYGTFRRTRDAWRWATSGRVPWDYSGVWVLRRDGSVISPPRGGAEPPGLYPSPHRAGTLELWTGCAWSGQYERWAR